ncbi:hypothetical protein JKF63_02112 [Porcisia hertigi]|uniref:SKP1 component dimerisation domain-containing protein n=1 Tax=Porcisia hertigi TaxID=2761500 RepID=A0A836HLP1_9TRYP|nr:hypothetical protein JKF63_02112 [Porcisia hertigi]
MEFRTSTLKVPNTFAPVGQTLILIASDGVRVPVKRAIATEASFVLRDLLDEQDLQPNLSRDGGGPSFSFSGDERLSPHLSGAEASDAANDLDNFFSVVSTKTPLVSSEAGQSSGLRQDGGGVDQTVAAKSVTKSAVPDLMDFFPVEPTTDPQVDIGAEAPNSVEATALSKASPSPPAACAFPTRETLSLNLPPMPPLSEVEVPFPYFSGDILERVCRHMSYRFRMSSFGAEDGCYHVYVVKTRPIPRPMTLPLVEYLDAKDRAFIADWDELITVQMVKAATLLNYEELLQLASAKLASYLIDRDLEGVRTLLGVRSDFDSAEDTELKKEQVVDYFR